MSINRKEVKKETSGYQGSENSKCKGPGVGAYVAYAWNRKEASVAGS